MKKIFLIGIFSLLVAGVSFAYCGYGNNSRGCIQNNPYAGRVSGNNRRNSNFNKRHFISRNSNDFSKEIEKIQISLDEKNLEIRKETIKDTPDWNKIETLNIEIATELAKFRTKIQKERYENLKKYELEAKEANQTSVK